MTQVISPLAGQPAPAELLIDVTFNEWHVLAITQALCDQRRASSISGPLFMGVDTHALSAPAAASALEVLAANGVDVMLAYRDEPTPTPAVSHAIVTHHPPRDGGFKYNLGHVIDMEAIRGAGLRLGVDPPFGFMPPDWDGQIRMDPSSPSAMQQLIALKDRYDIAFACDTDHDRHGIVTPAHALLPPNHCLCVAMDYLFRHRPQWGRRPASARRWSARSRSTAWRHRSAASSLRCR